MGTPWYVAGGWAVDLHLGRPTREHEDLEIGVPRERFAEVEADRALLAPMLTGDEREWLNAALPAGHPWIS